MKHYEKGNQNEDGSVSTIYVYNLYFRYNF